MQQKIIKQKKEKIIRKLVLVFAITLVLAGVCLLPTVIKAVFSDPIDLTEVGEGKDPSIDVDSVGIVHTVWAEHVNGKDIIYAKSTDGGETFPELNRINLSTTSLNPSVNPWIKVDSNDVIHVVWEQDTEDQDSEVYYVKSSDHGANFSSPKDISNSEFLSISPHVETSQGDKIHITWTGIDILNIEGEMEEVTQVFYASSVDGGDNFSSPVNISNTLHNLDNPTTQANGDFLITLWKSENYGDYGIYRVISVDNGANWGSALKVSGDTGAAMPLAPKVGIDGGGRIHVVAGVYFGYKDIYYWRSLDDGASFETGVNISDTPEKVSERPSIITTGDKTVHIIWAEKALNGGQSRKRVYKVKSNTGGNNFSAPGPSGPLQNFVGVEESDVDVYGSDAYIIWQERGVIRFSKGK